MELKRIISFSDLSENYNKDISEHKSNLDFNRNPSNQEVLSCFSNKNSNFSNKFISNLDYNEKKKNKFSYDFFTENNMNINFKNRRLQREITNHSDNFKYFKNKFTYIDKDNPILLDKYSLKKYMSITNPKRLLELKHKKSSDAKFNSNTNDIIYQNSDNTVSVNNKNCFLSTKNNSIKIITKQSDKEKSSFLRSVDDNKFSLDKKKINRHYSLKTKESNAIKVEKSNYDRVIYTSQNKIIISSNNETNKGLNTLNKEPRNKVKFSSNTWNIEKKINIDINYSAKNDMEINKALEENEKLKNNKIKINYKLDIKSKNENLKFQNIKNLDDINPNRDNGDHIKNKQSDISNLDFDLIEADIKRRDENRNINDQKAKFNNSNKNTESNSRQISSYSKRNILNKNSYNGNINDKSIKKINSRKFESLDIKNNYKIEEYKESRQEIFFCEKMFSNLVLSLLSSDNLRILEIELSANIDLEILSINLLSFITNSKNIKRVKLLNKSNDEEFSIKEKDNYLTESIFEFKSKKVNERILDCGKILVTKNFSFFEPKNYYIIYKGSVKLFCDYFKAFKNLFFVNYLRELSLQNDEIDINYAYFVREIFEKTVNLEILELKNLGLKCDFFEIIADKINVNKFIRKIIFYDLMDINEKSLNIFFKRLYNKNLSFLVMEKIDAGEIFLSSLSRGKFTFPNLISFTFKPLRKLYHGISLLNEFFKENKSLIEFKINITNIDDFYKLDEIITDHRFIKFELD